MADQIGIFFIEADEGGHRKVNPLFSFNAGRGTMTVTETDFERTVQTIRERDEEEHTGFWFNLIRYRDCGFLQGSVIEENAPRGVFRNIALLWEGTDAGSLDGFWPEVSGRPVTPSEENLIIEYLSSRHPGEVELVVPERNTARPVEWDIFENSREYRIYKDHIYPEVIGVMEEIDSGGMLNKLCL